MGVAEGQADAGGVEAVAVAADLAAEIAAEARAGGQPGAVKGLGDGVDAGGGRQAGGVDGRRRIGRIQRWKLVVACHASIAAILKRDGIDVFAGSGHMCIVGCCACVGKCFAANARRNGYESCKARQTVVNLGCRQIYRLGGDVGGRGVWVQAVVARIAAGER